MRSEAAAFYRNPSGNVVADATNGMIWSAVAINKQIEFLHKQLIRKGRARQFFIDTQKWGRVYYIPDALYTEGSSILIDGGYNISTGGVQPYTREGRDNLGLSQLFNKQKPSEPYRGPDDGQITDSFWIGKTDFYRFRISAGKSIGNIIGQTGLYPSVDTFASAVGAMHYEQTTSYVSTYHTLNGWQTSSAYIAFADTDRGLLYLGYPFRGGKTDPDEFSAYAAPLFYADSNSPIMGTREFLKTWNSYHTILYKSKTKINHWKTLLSAALIIASFVVSFMAIATYAPLATATIGGSSALGLSGIAAIVATIGGVGGFIATIGSLSGKKSLAKFGRVMGFIGAIGSIYLSVKSLFTQSVAAQNASTATNQAVAGASGANQTCQLYNGVSVSSWAGTNAGASSAANAAQGVSIGGFAAAGATSTSQLYLTTALKIVGIGSKAFALVQDIRSEFRKHGDTQDTDMQEQSDDEKVISVNSDAQQDDGDVTRRFYERDVEYDIGLEGGTLISIDDSILDEPNSAVKSI